MGRAGSSLAEAGGAGAHCRVPAPRVRRAWWPGPASKIERMVAGARRSVLLGGAATGAILGAVALLAPRPLARLGLVGDAGEGVWILRIFAARELCLAWGLGRAALAAAPEPGRTVSEMLALSQAGDLAVTLYMAVRGGLRPGPAVATVIASASTLGLALALRRSYGAR